MDLFADRLSAQSEKYIRWKLNPFAISMVANVFLTNLILEG